jgi:hypothetical protein
MIRHQATASRTVLLSHSLPPIPLYPGTTSVPRGTEESEVTGGCLSVFGLVSGFLQANMLPRKKARQTRQSPLQVHSQSKVAEVTFPSNGPFATLPAELILLIIAFFPAIPVPHYLRTPITDDTYFRSWTLFALSQTNSWLRRVVFPYSWGQSKPSTFIPSFFRPI